MKNRLFAVIALSLLAAFHSQLTTAQAQGTAFSYQGQLDEGGDPANAHFDLAFTLFSTNIGGVPFAGPITNFDTAVSNGLFTTTIDFGVGAFTGASNWLEIAVRTSGGAGFVKLAPRQLVTPAPYAIYAENVNNVTLTLPASQLTSIGNTNGGDNFFIGPSGNSTTSGYFNSSIGDYALFFNTSGSENAATGTFALGLNTSGEYNTADGYSALYLNTNGSFNVAVGSDSLFNNRSGSYNTANGYEVLENNSTASYNSGYGAGALLDITTGSSNIAIGPYAGSSIFTGNNNIDIGNTGFSDESETIRIGTAQTKAVISGIYGGNIISGSELVCVNPSGLLGTSPAGGAVLAGNLEIGTESVDYRFLEMGGGNSEGFLYGSFPAFGDGLHLGYNYYADAGGTGHVINTGGGTSRISPGYADISLFVGDVNTAPTTLRLDANLTGVTVYGTFNNSSDRNAKQDFAPVSSSAILDKVLRLPLSEWSYKTDTTTRHIGPMGQDFYSTFNIGTDEKHIAPIDEGGVALAAIQGLNQKLEQKDAEIQDLKARLEKLEQLMTEKIGGAK